MLTNNALPFWLSFLMKWEGSCIPAEGETPAQAFNRCRERAYSCDAHDLGGATQMGLTLRTYNTWRTMFLHQPQATADQLHAIAYGQWEQIVTELYWNMPGFRHVPFDCMALAFADDYFHSGRAGIRDIQRILGCTPEGIIGPKTTGAMRHRIRTRQAARDITRQLLDIRLARLQTLHTWPRFGQGWTNRINDLAQLIPRLDLTVDGE